MADGPEGYPRPPVVDTSRPNVARVFNALLGGKDNYQADRDVRDALLRRAPELTRLAWDAREFLLRATRFLAANAGIGQFLDCGPGLPTGDNTHQVAQRANPEASFVYVARDPIVLAHGRALLAENDRTHFADVDFRHPERVFADPTVRKVLDFEQPIGLLHVGTMQYVADSWCPHELMARYVEALPSGSYVAVGHLHDPGGGNEAVPRLREAFDEIPVVRGYFRGRDEIRSHLAGLDLVEPGLVRVSDWWPDGPRVGPLDPVQDIAVGAVGRKP